MNVSFVIPTYNEELNIIPLYNKIVKYADKETLELIFVDDGSTDRTLNQLEKLSEKSAKVKYISFSRNFGHQSAIKAGLKYASGECVILMDADLQHPPSLIPQMVEKWEQGFDIVNTIRTDNQGTSYLKKVSSSVYYKIFNALSEVKLERGSADFRLIDRKVVDVLNNDINEYHLFYRGMISWLGYSQTTIEYISELRKSGNSKYSFLKMLKLGLDGITSFSIKPLKFSIVIGFFLSLLTGLYAIYALVMYLFVSETVKGWTSVLLSILFIGGVNMIILGVIGEYVGKIYLQSKNRPNYLVKKSNFQIDIKEF